jgi:surfeit locus 1 family protein
MPSRKRGTAFLLFLGAGALLLFTALVGLGTWQVERMGWKRDLIARVEARIHADALPAPARVEWPDVSAERDAYRRVSATGLLRYDAETLVQAVTELGGGYWVITPLLRDDGSTLLVNRGFVPSDRRDPADRASGQSNGQTTITGLLRMSEPKGGFLRTNDPSADRWYSRDVAAIAAARGLSDVAPYFIDADATAKSGTLPVGGLTVIAFHDNHLVYAITWYALAVMVAGAALYVFRDARERSP